MKKLLLTLSLLLFVVVHSTAKTPKYIFYFIGDGMGLPSVTLAEIAFKGDGHFGYSPLLFSSFPVQGTATTYCSNSFITDSAAAGTALATGSKTTSETLGLDAEGKKVKSIASEASEEGMAVALITSVSIDHATPAAFYAHQSKRSMYYDIACDGAKSGFNLLAGSGFLKPEKEGHENIFDIYNKNGYAVLRGKEELSKLKALNGKYAVVCERKGAVADNLALAIDRTPADLSIADITHEAIGFVESIGGDKGFFMMIEGGQIDWAAHSNDASAIIHEIVDMDAAVKVAYEFMQRHPDETLIVVTADHETGGLGLGYFETGYSIYPEVLLKRTISKALLSEKIVELQKSNNRNAKQLEVLLTKAGIEKGDTKIFDEKERNYLVSLLTASPLTFAEELVKRATAKAGVSWTTTAHTGSPVMIYAVGAGSEAFVGRHDNTDIPKIIRKYIKGDE